MPGSPAPDDFPAALDAVGLVETLAAFEHERWSHWQRYLHSKCQPADDGSLVIPAEFVSRWEQQMSTPYAALSDDEKESDREQVRHVLPVISAAFRNERVD
jgi:hypothetical protein